MLSSARGWSKLRKHAVDPRARCLQSWLAKHCHFGVLRLGPEHVEKAALCLPSITSRANLLDTLGARPYPVAPAYNLAYIVIRRIYV